MLTFSKLSLPSFALASLMALSACASHAPRVSNAALGYAVTNYAIAADGAEKPLSDALGSALLNIGIATAMPAKADVTIDVLRYNSPIIGLFYGGRHYASLSVVLTDNSGSIISSFPLYVAANGGRSEADADLAEAAAQVIAARAANAYMAIRTNSKANFKPVVAPVAAPIIDTPIAEVPNLETIAPENDDATPCVIGPDGKCVVL